MFIYSVGQEFGKGTAQMAYFCSTISEISAEKTQKLEVT